MEEYIWSLLLLLPKGRPCSSNVCLLLSTDAKLYRYDLTASEDLRAWLWATIILGNRQRNYTFISQCSEQKHLSKATRPGWMQAAMKPWNPWGSFILTLDCYRRLQLLRALSKTHGLYLTRARQRDGPEDSPPLASAKLIQGLGLKCQRILNERQFVLAPATEVILPMALDLVIKNRLHMV